jgi:nucleoside diphosphate kinase
MNLALILAKPQLLEKRRLKTVVRLIEDEGFFLLDMCLLHITPYEFEAFMKQINQTYEPVEATLYGQGRSALFAVHHKSDEFYVHGGRVEQGSKARFLPGAAAVETWFGKLSK